MDPCGSNGSNGSNGSMCRVSIGYLGDAIHGDAINGILADGDAIHGILAEKTGFFSRFMAI